MKRLCVFAHWDRDNIVDDYVIYYLKALKEVCSTIIFVSDTDGTDISALNGIVDYCLVKKHGEYDFGSYKRGFFFALENKIEFDELLFVNDSCYGPFSPLKPVFDKMSERKCDWWGVTQNSYGIAKNGDKSYSVWMPHIQSYFLVFKSSVFKSVAFSNFMSSIKKENSKVDVIINYEMGLTKLLDKNKFRRSVYINRYRFIENCTLSRWKQLIKFYKFPFLKTMVAKNGLFITGEVTDWSRCIESISDYPVLLVRKNSERLKNPQENIYASFNLYRKIRYKILNNSPKKCREIVSFLEKNVFKFLNTLCFNKLKKF